MPSSSDSPPQSIDNEAVLNSLLSEPTPNVVDCLGNSSGNILILGAGGKIGPSLAMMARRALNLAGNDAKVIAVSRFSDQGVRQLLEENEVVTHVADLFDREAVAALPEAGTVYFLLGRKFGTTGSEALSWASNVALPTIVCQRFGGSRIVALSTLCVYPFVSVTSRGSKECDNPAPIGEYAMSTLGRERVFEHFSVANASPTALIRLTYSVEMRYGVLVDIATRVWRGEPVDLSMSHVNLLWQADANARILSAVQFADTPARPLNVAGPEHYSVRNLAEQFGKAFQKEPTFVGKPSTDAWLPAPSDEPTLSEPPRVPIDRLIDWTVDWIRRAGSTHNKATHYEVRDGRF